MKGQWTLGRREKCARKGFWEVPGRGGLAQTPEVQPSGSRAGESTGATIQRSQVAGKEEGLSLCLRHVFYLLTWRVHSGE